MSIGTLLPSFRPRRTRSATLIKHNGHRGHKGKPTGFVFVSFVSFALIQRRYTEAKTDLIRDAVVLTRSAALQACPGTPLAALKGCATSGGPANTSARGISKPLDLSDFLLQTSDFKRRVTNR